MVGLLANTRRWAVALTAGLLLPGFAPAFGQPQRPPVADTRLQESADAARADRLREILEERSLREDQIRITDFEGRDLTRELLRPPIADDQPARLAERQVVVRPAELVSMRLPSERIDLPGGIAQVEESPRDPAVGDGWFHPTLFASPTPAVWDESQRRYTTRLSLGLRGENVSPGTDLSQPVTVKLGFRGLVADPITLITLHRAGVEHEKHVDFRFIPTTERPVLEMRSTIVDIDFEIEAMARMELHSERNHMTGLGLEKLRMNVLRLQPHGQVAVAADNRIATVAVTGPAIADVSQIEFPAGSAAASFMLQSRGLEDVTVRVSDGQYTASYTIEQRFPFGPLVAVLAGGALGGFARRFSSKAPSASTGARIGEGVVVALIAFVAGVLGVGYINLPPAVIATEAGAFLTGALTGLVGVTVIETLSRRLGTATG